MKAYKTSITFNGTKILLNGRLTYEGNPQAEGLLFNIRTVNATFDDTLGKSGYWNDDAARVENNYAGYGVWQSPKSAFENTHRFIEALPQYKASGILAVNLNFQGGHPLLAKPWIAEGRGSANRLKNGQRDFLHNSGFGKDGTIDENYVRRIGAVIEACDSLGMVVILQLFYFGQDTVFLEEEAICNAVDHTIDFICKNQYHNVLVEIANEVMEGHYHHKILKPGRIAELIKRARNRAKEKYGRQIFVSTSEAAMLDPGQWSTGQIDTVFEASDFVLLHGGDGLNHGQVGDHTEVAKKIDYIFSRPWFQNKPRPILFNESDGELAFECALKRKVSFGLHNDKYLQTLWPPKWGIWENDTSWFFKKAAKATNVSSGDAAPYFPAADAQSGWRILKNPEDILRITGMDKMKLDQAFEYIKKDTKNGGLLVVKDGWLVYERYFGKGHREAAPNLASCGKAFTSIAMGILLSERPEMFPEGLEQKVFTPDFLPQEAFPLSDPAKAGIKLGHLLAFTGGIRGNNPVYTRGETKIIDPAGPDGWESCLDLVAYGKKDILSEKGVPLTASTLWCEPGSGYSYATSSIHLVSVILRHVSGMELKEYLDKHLAGPMEWGRWGYGYGGHPELVHTPGGAGIALRSTDVLRFGYMLLHEGRWKESQRVSAEYVKHCSRKSPYNPHYPYSLQFNVNTDGGIPDIPQDAFWKSGSGGHCLYVVPSLNMVVWKLGGRDDQYSGRNTGLPEPSVQEDKKSAEGWVKLVDSETARLETLRRVIGAIKNPVPISGKRT